MRTREEMLFNRTIASFLLQKTVRSVEEWSNCVFVVPTEGRPTFVSKKLFLQAFVEMRRLRSHSLAAWQTSSTSFTVHNPENGNRYEVCFKGQPTCTCEDYKNQVALWGKGCCKHIYRALREWGFESLRDYEKEIRRLETSRK